MRFFIKANSHVSLKYTRVSMRCFKCAILCISSSNEFVAPKKENILVQKELP